MLFVRLSGSAACWQFGDAAAWSDLRALYRPARTRAPAGPVRSDDSRTFAQFMSPCLAVNLAHSKRCMRRRTPKVKTAADLHLARSSLCLSSFNCWQCQWSSYYCRLYSQTKHEPNRTEHANSRLKCSDRLTFSLFTIRSSTRKACSCMHCNLRPPDFAPVILGLWVMSIHQPTNSTVSQQSAHNLRGPMLQQHVKLQRNRTIRTEFMAIFKYI